MDNSQEVIDLAVAKEEEVEPQPSSSRSLQGIMFFTILEILENFYILGLSSLSKWEKVMTELKDRDEIVSDPIMTQIFACLKPFHKIFYTHMSSTPNVSQKTFENISQLDVEFEDLEAIWAPEAEKKQFKSKVFTPEQVQKFGDVIRKILGVMSDEDEVVDKDTFRNLEKRVKRKDDVQFGKNKKAKLDYIRGFSSNESAGSSDESDSEDTFAKLFKRKQSTSLKISQQFQYNSGTTRRKITTPGEKGSHLIKVEITDTRDLKQCKSEKFYWQKVNKKGYFLLNVNENEDQQTLQSLVEILAKVATKVSKIKNAKFESFESTDAKK